MILPLVFVGGVFYSVDVLPSPWEELSHVNPVFYLVNAVRFGFLGESDVSIWLSLGVTAALALPVFPVVTASVRKRQALGALETRGLTPAAGAARGSSSGASGWRARSAPRSRTRTTGAGRCRASATRRARLRARARSGGARRQPHRPRLHRRPLRRLALRVDAPDRLREPAESRAPRRRPAARRRLHRGRGALRAAGEQAAAEQSATTACPTPARSSSCSSRP